MNKTILLASFIFPERVDWFLNYLKTTFNVDSVFCYKNDADEEDAVSSARPNRVSRSQQT